MAKATNQRKDFEVGEAPLFFSGQPPDLLGHLELRNRSPEKVKVRALTLKNLQLKVPQGRYDPNSALNFARTLSKIEPGTKARVPMRLQLSSDTPPGVYDGQVECDGEARDVKVQVLESWKLELLPAALSFKVPTRDPVRATIRVTNTGNMLYTVHRAAEFLWEEKRCSQKSFVPDFVRGPNDKTKREASKHSETDSDVDGTLSIQSKDRSLKPGETREIELEIQVPDALKPGRVYCGCVPFEQAHLRLDLEVLEDSEIG